MSATARLTRSIVLGLLALLCAGSLFLLWQGWRLDQAAPSSRHVDPSYFMGDQSDWLLDFGEIGDIDAATLPTILDRMNPSNGKMPGVGLRYYQGGKLWLHFAVPDLEPSVERWVVRLNNYRVREAHLLLIKGEVIVRRDWAYDDTERRSGLGTRIPAFEFDRDALEGAEVLLGFNSLGAMRGAVAVEAARAFHAGETRQAAIYSLLLGVMWVLAAYLLVIGMRLGERSLMVAAGLAFSLGIFVYGVGGYVHFQLLPAWPKLADVVLYASQPWPPALWLLLTVTYLDLPRRKPRLALGATIVALLLPFQGILTLLTALGYPVPFITDNATPVMIGVTLGLALVIGFSLAGDRRARGLLLAFTPLGVGSIARTAAYLLPAPDPAVTAIMDLYPDMVITVLLIAVIVVLDLQRRETHLRDEAISNEQRFRAYAEIASDSYFEADRGGVVTQVAGGLARELSLREGESLEAALLNHLEGDARPIVQKVRSVFTAQDRVDDLEVRVRLGSGEQGWLLLHLVPMKAQGDVPDGLRGTISDITERVQRRDQEARQGTLSALGQLASGVAHEVNNLLHPMVNLAQRVRDKHTSDPEARKLLDLVVASGKHAGEIVAGVLNAFNPVRLPGERQPVAIALQSALDTVRPTVPATVRLKETISTGSRQTIPPGEMLQVVSNLLSNAIRAMDGAGEIAVSLAEEADGATVMVFADNGPGMPDHIRQRASEPFVTGRADGTGLGLAVVANIVRNWNGDFDIDSALGRGTTIRIRIQAFWENVDE